MTATLTEQTIGADRAIHLQSLVLVASKSHPGQWHQVASGRCDCDGYTFRSTCRHLAVAAAAERQEIASHRPSTTHVVAHLECGACHRHATKLYGGRCNRCISNLD